MDDPHQLEIIIALLAAVLALATCGRASETLDGPPCDLWRGCWRVRAARTIRRRCRCVAPSRGGMA